MAKVSVIVPVFKVEKFVGRCIRSLMEQTLEDVEYIIVDDASPDGSMDIVRDIIKEYPQRNVRTLTHPVNKGLPAARNTGLEAASGEYIYHCDSDDWVEPTILEKLCNAAVSNEADFVYCDYFLSFEKNERYMGNPDYSSADELLRKGFLGGAMKYNVWNKLIHRSLYESTGAVFPEGHAMGEDMTVIQLVTDARKVLHVKEALYHYVKLNGEAYSSSYSEQKLKDIRYNVDRTATFLEKKYGDAIAEDIGIFKLTVKLPFIISDKREDYRRWSEWYPESNRYAMRNKALPLRTRILQWMAAKKLHTGVWLYNKLVYKFIYGIIYK